MLQVESPQRVNANVGQAAEVDFTPLANPEAPDATKLRAIDSSQSAVMRALDGSADNDLSYSNVAVRPPVAEEAEKSVLSQARHLANLPPDQIPQAIDQLLAEHGTRLTKDQRSELRASVESRVEELQKIERERDQQIERFISEQAVRLASVHASQLTPEQNKAREELLSKFGNGISAEQRAQLLELFQEHVSFSREQALHTQLLRETRKLAQNDHNRGRNSAIDERAATSMVEELSARYSDVLTDPRQSAKIQSSFERVYGAERDRQYEKWYDNLSWAEKRYHDVRSWTESAIGTMKRVGSAIGHVVGRVAHTAVVAASATAEVTKELVNEGVQAVAEVANKVQSRVAQAVVSTVDTLTSAETWTKVGNAAVGTIRAAGSALIAVAEVGGELIVEGVKLAGAAIAAAGSGIAQAAKWSWNAGGQALRWASKLENWKDVGSACWSGICAAGRGIANAYDFITSKDTWIAVGRGIASAWDFATSKDTWTAIGNGIAKAADVVWSATKWTVSTLASGISKGFDILTSKETWVTIGQAIVNSAQWTAKLVYNIVTDPKAAWEQIKTAAEKGWDVTKAVAQAAWTGAKAAYNFAVKHGETAWNFVKGISDDIGLSALVKGAVDLALMPTRFIIQAGRSAYEMGKQFALLASGQIDKDQFKLALRGELGKTFGVITDAMRSGANGLLGGLKLAGELTGINDLGRAVYHAFQGNWGQATMYLGFAALSAGALVATVATGGAAVGSIAAVATGRATASAAAKTVLSTAGRKFFSEGIEVAAKNIGQTALEKISVELQQATAREIAERGTREIAERALVQGADAISTKAFRETFREVSHEATEKLLRDSGVGEVIYKGVRESLEELASRNKKSLRATFMNDYGMSKKQAGKFANEAHRVIKNGKADGELAEMFTTHISREISDGLQKNMAPEFQRHFGQIMRNELTEGSDQLLKDSALLNKLAKEKAEKLGKNSDQYIDELVESATKGVREGIESAVQKITREAVERAFREFRMGRYIPRGTAGGASSGVGLGLEASSEAEGETPMPILESEHNRAELREDQEKQDSYVRLAIDDSGNQVMITMTFSPKDGKYIEAGRQLVGEGTAAQVRKGRLLSEELAAA
jgi:hypothetical protein